MITVEAEERTDDLVEALRRIKGYCRKHTECVPQGKKACRLYDEKMNCCFVTNSDVPEDWPLPEEDTDDADI